MVDDVFFAHYLLRSPADCKLELRHALPPPRALWVARHIYMLSLLCGMRWLGDRCTLTTASGTWAMHNQNMGTVHEALEGHLLWQYQWTMVNIRVSDSVVKVIGYCMCAFVLRGNNGLSKIMW